MASPPKPWERGGSGASAVTARTVLIYSYPIVFDLIKTSACNNGITDHFYRILILTSNPSASVFSLFSCQSHRVKLFDSDV